MTPFVDQGSIAEAVRQRQTEVERHWQSVTRRTDPINEDEARAAVSDLMLEITARRPKAVVCLSSPYQCLVAAGFVRGPVKPYQTQVAATALPLLSAGRRLQTIGSGEDLSHATVELSRMVEIDYHRSVGALVDTALRRFEWSSTPDAIRQQAGSRVAAQSRHLPDAIRTELFRTTGREKYLPTQEYSWSRGPSVLNVEMGTYYSRLAQHELATSTRLGRTFPLLRPGLYQRLRDACDACGWFWLAGDVAFASDRPEVVRLDAQGRAHAAGEPAIRYRDGFEVYAMEGFELDPILFRNPDKASVQSVEEERNTERRRVMIQAMGAERYLSLSGAARVHEDETGILWKRNFFVDRVHTVYPRVRALPQSHAICFVEVANGTRERDGSRRRYFLRVPPSMITARAAVAWTYGLKPEQYVPTLRT